MAPSAAATSTTPADPHGFGPVIGGLGMLARRTGKALILLLADNLDDDERVELLALGRFLGEAGTVAVTDRRILLLNDREWKPDVESIPFGPGVSVQGWADDRAATLAFERGGRQVVIDQIGDREAAQRIAGLVRARCGV